MTEVKGEQAPVAPALGVSLNIQISPNRQIVFQTHVDAAATADDLNTLLDKLLTVGDRAEAFYQIDVAEQDLERNVIALENMQARLAVVDNRMQEQSAANNNRRNPSPAAGKDQADRRQVVEQIEIAKKNVEKATAWRDGVVKKAGTRGSAADRGAGVPDR